MKAKIAEDTEFTKSVVHDLERLKTER